MKRVAFLLTLVLSLAGASAAAGPRLDAIKSRGALHCGVATAEAGMSVVRPGGQFVGFEADLCRAIAIAIFGTPKVVFKPTTTLQDFLRTEDTDLVIRGLTWSFQREVNSNVRFGPIYYHDGQTFLVRASSGIGSIATLSRRTICVSSDTFADFYPPLERAFATRNVVLRARRVQTRAEAEQIFFAGGCDAVTADRSELVAAVIARGGTDAGSYNILGEMITEEPLAPLLRKGDDQFFDIVQWSIYALINAEAYGLTSQNLAARRNSAEWEIVAFFRAPAPSSGFAPGWNEALVKTLGNYGEMYRRHFRVGPWQADRYQNALWTQGGRLYAPPLR
jgi:general L-amino acid transport system substrate-binding protein